MTHLPPIAAVCRLGPRRAARLAAAAAGLAGLAACSASVPGASGYSCSGMPDGVVCESARDMHALTSTRDRVHEADLAAGSVAAVGVPAGMAAPAREAHAASGPREGVVDAAVLAPTPVAALDVDAVARSPRRGAPGVVRIWIAPWEDRQGDLRMPGYVFAEVRPPRWSLSDRPAHVTANHLQTPAMIDARDRPVPAAGGGAPAAGEPLQRRGTTPHRDLGPSQRRAPPEDFREARG